MKEIEHLPSCCKLAWQASAEQERKRILRIIENEASQRSGSEMIILDDLADRIEGEG